MLALILGAVLGAQAEPPAAGPLGRFVICPGNVRCPPRPYGRPNRAGATRHERGNPTIAGLIANATGAPMRNVQSIELIFAPDRAELTEEAGEMLGPITRRLRASPGLEAVVEGHAGPRGDPAASVALAGRRAEATAAYLAGQGVAAERILLLSWGEAAVAGAGAEDSVVVTLRPRPPAR